MNPIFEIVVGNIGSVYSGNNFMQARSTYTQYVELSRNGHGRASGEAVTFFHNGEVRMEFPGVNASAE